MKHTPKPRIIRIAAVTALYDFARIVEKLDPDEGLSPDALWHLREMAVKVIKKAEGGTRGTGCSRSASLDTGKAMPGELPERCGNCQHWMKKPSCPREAKYKPTINDVPCDKYQRMGE